MDRKLHRTVALGLVCVSTAAAGCTPLQPSSARVYLAGDVMAGRTFHGFDAHDWGVAFSEVNTVISDADLVVFNLESPLQSDAVISGDMDLTTGPFFLEVFPGKTPALATTANNHSRDRGVSGLLRTCERLEEYGVYSVGAADETVLIPIGDDDWLAAAFDDTPMNDTAFEDFLAQLSPCAEGLCLVSVHWGDEYTVQPSSRQRELARSLAEAGVEVVLGHHPHVLQPVEWIDTQGGRTLVAYSMGNLLFDMTLPDSRRIALLRMETGGGQILDVCAVPLSMLPGKWVIKHAGAVDTVVILRRLGVPECLPVGGGD